MQIPKIKNDWDNLLEAEFKQENYQNLRNFLLNEYSSYKIYPDKNDIFNSLKYTPYKDVKIVILGQDPYIKEGEAHGLAFSVSPNIKIPPSLMNIYKELQSDIGCYIPNSGCLINWTKQGVLLLNSVLTVRSGQSNSHKNKGWEKFTHKIIELLNDKNEPIIFMLWGNNAKEKSVLLNNPNHLVLKAPHPSPLAGGAFFGCKHFSKANNFLRINGIEPIDWQI
jgi:uracil-DNA glycosylase